MSKFDEAIERDMILFVGSYLSVQHDSLEKLSQTLGKKLTACVLIDQSDPNKRKDLPHDKNAVVLECDFASDLAIDNLLMPYKRRLIAVTCRSDKNVERFKRIIPHVPHLNSPTEISLSWTMNKIRMRRMLRNFDKKISPKFMVVHDATSETMQKIESRIGFPLIIKPAGLAKSLLVNICYHQEELEENLKNTVKKISRIYEIEQGRGEPQILVEEFMEGTMYSIDSYVNQRGTVYHTPLVHVKTGMSVGFEDFFGYQRITPVRLKPHKVEAARKVAEETIEALNLRSVTCHIELMKTEDGWKVIELNARIGGFRHEMYELSYGIDHSTNDILIRIPRKPVLPKKIKGYTAVLQFYSRKKGRLSKLEGINRVRNLESFNRINIKKKIGDLCDFARNGDNPVFDIVLFNQDRSRLLADIRRLEKTVKIIVKRPKRA